jgi:Cu2+-exporting ATPase
MKKMDKMHSGGHSHNHSKDFKDRFWVTLFLSIPVLILSPMIQDFFNYSLRFPYDKYVLFLLGTIIFFYGGIPFFKGARKELGKKAPGMMTLIAFAISVSYIYSSLVTFINIGGHELFWELATLIVIMLLGHWIEMKSVAGASDAVDSLAKLMPDKAFLIEKDGNLREVPVNELKAGDKIKVRSGDRIAADGKILIGQTSVNESLITGESMPVEKIEGDFVIGGSINGDGTIDVEVGKVGDDSYLSQVIKLVKEGKSSKTKTENLANKAAGWLFYIALLTGSATFITWIISGYPINFAVERMVAVFVIACPHALGLAIPLVIAVSSGISAKKGFLVKNRDNFENARKINGVVFDKTGTLTKGSFGVMDVITENDIEEKDLLSVAASLEVFSSHPIAKGIMKYVKEKEIEFKEAQDMKNISGKGVFGTIDNKEYFAVSPGYIKENNIEFPEAKFNSLSEQGKTVIFIGQKDSLLGMIALGDEIRKESFEAIEKLKNMGIRTIMLTGDNDKVAQWVASQLGLDEFHSQVLPEDKKDHIKELQNKGYKIAMTGDGINDAPALAVADLGIAIGAGTDVAVDTADVILVKNNPLDVPFIISFSDRIYKKMIQNLAWATGYNILALPLAAGILYNQGIIISPAVGAVLMSLSTIIAAINAKLLKAPE